MSAIYLSQQTEMCHLCALREARNNVKIATIGFYSPSTHTHTLKSIYSKAVVDDESREKKSFFISFNSSIQLYQFSCLPSYATHKFDKFDKIEIKKKILGELFATVPNMLQMFLLVPYVSLSICVRCDKVERINSFALQIHYFHVSVVLHEENRLFDGTWKKDCRRRRHHLPPNAFYLTYIYSFLLDRYIILLLILSHHLSSDNIFPKRKKLMRKSRISCNISILITV